MFIHCRCFESYDGTSAIFPRPEHGYFLRHRAWSKFYRVLHSMVNRKRRLIKSWIRLDLFCITFCLVLHIRYSIKIAYFVPCKKEMIPWGKIRLNCQNISINKLAINANCVDSQLFTRFIFLKVNAHVSESSTSI